jgi:phosphoribosylanthranilate isomerase
LFVKICGITRVEDAQAAVELGADAIGFVFWPGSPRFVDPERAREIIGTLPAGVMAVGVFVNQPAEDVNTIAARAGLAAVQMHGDETASYIATLTRPVIKAVVAGKDSVSNDWPERVTLLVDAHDPIRRGGTGLKADWSAAALLARTRRVLLAGGLTPENVAEAIAAVQPFGIDVSSGVELTPGVKDHQRLAALFVAVAKC